jgi:hypothetical protein
VSLLLGACAEYSADEAPQAGSGDAASPADTSSDATETAPSSPDSGALIPEAAYYALDLRFAIRGGTEEAGGTWQADAAALSVELWSEAPEPICRHSVPIVAATEEAPPETGPALLAWWRLDLDPGLPVDGCPDFGARTWWIGVGPYDDRLDPMLAERGMLAFDVYGLYLREEADGPLFIVGYAGTNEMVLGEQDLTVEEAPLPDGGYQGQSLVLMSLAAR